MKKWLIVSIILVVLISAIILGFVIKKSLIFCTKEAKICPDGTAVGRTGLNCNFESCPIENENNLDICKFDSDCIVVDYNHCCGASKRAINKEYLVQYDNHSEWKTFNDPEICAVIGQCALDNYVSQSICKDGATGKRCVLVY